MGFAIQLFFLVLGAVLKRYLLPAFVVIAVITLVAGFSGGSWLWAALISAAIAVVAALVAACASIHRGW